MAIVETTAVGETMRLSVRRGERDVLIDVVPSDLNDHPPAFFQAQR